ESVQTTLDANQEMTKEDPVTVGLEKLLDEVAQLSDHVGGLASKTNRAIRPGSNSRTRPTSSSTTSSTGAKQRVRGRARLDDKNSTRPSSRNRDIGEDGRSTSAYPRSVSQSPTKLYRVVEAGRKSPSKLDNGRRMPWERSDGTASASPI
ncbi:unnamed protein product, partial [Amoebophrya sp. A25]